MVDEEIKYSEKVKKYSLSELIDVSNNIDYEKYPERYQLVLNEIEKRKVTSFISFEDKLRLGIETKDNSESPSFLTELIYNIKQGHLKKSVLFIFRSINSFLIFILYLLYTYYRSGKPSRSTAYSRAIFAFMAVVFINALSLAILIKYDVSKIFIWQTTDPKWKQYISCMIQFSPLYFIIRIIYPEKNIIIQNYKPEAIYFGKKYLLTYIIISVMLFFFSAVMIK